MRKIALSSFFLLILYICGWGCITVAQSQEFKGKDKEFYDAGLEKLKAGVESIKDGKFNLSLYITNKEKFVDLIGTDMRSLDIFYVDLVIKMSLEHSVFPGINDEDRKKLIEKSQKNNSNRVIDFLEEIANSEIIKENIDARTIILGSEEKPGCKQKIENIKNKYDKGENLLKEAISNFEQAIAYNPEFIDAHIRKAQAYMELGLNEEAIKTYEVCRKIGFGNLTMDFKEAKDIVFRLAEICNRGLVIKPDGNSPLIIYDCDYGLKIVEEFFSKNKERLIKTRDVSADLSYKSEIIDEIVKNDFGLVDYYIRIGRADLAKDEYAKKMAEYSKRIGMYGARVREFVNSIPNSIENIENVNCTFDVDLSSTIKKREYKSEAKFIFLPDFEKKNPDQNEMNLEDFIGISFYPNRPMISFSKQITINENLKKVCITLPKGEYRTKVIIQRLAFESPKVLPFKAKLNNNDLIVSKPKLTARYNPYSGILDRSFSPVEFEVDKKGNIKGKRQTKKGDYKNIEGFYYRAEAEFALDLKKLNSNQLSLKLEKNVKTSDDRPFFIPAAIFISVYILLVIIVASRDTPRGN